jgi:hypothetical protein
MRPSFKIKKLKPTQNGVRDFQLVHELADFVRQGGVFSCRGEGPCNYQNKIKIARFEDGVNYVRDGHHRVSAVLIAGRDYLDWDEVVVEDWKYEQWLLPNLEVGWVTPHDPRYEVRVHDLSSWKEKLRELNDIDKLSSIVRLRENYCEFRKSSIYNTMVEFLSYISK